MLTFGQYLRSLRNRAGLSQTRLAEAAAVSRRTIVYWEADERLPRLPELESALTALRVTPTEHTDAVARLGTPRARRRAREIAHQATPPQVGLPPTAGDLLKVVRRRRGRSSSDVAAALGVSSATIHRWERLELRPSEEQLYLFCAMLDAHPEELSVLQTLRWKSLPRPEGMLPLPLLRHRSEMFVQDCLDHRTPLIDMEALALRSDLWPQAVRSAEGRRLLAVVNADYGHWLNFQGRDAEARQAAREALEIAAPLGKADGAWLVAIDVQAALRAREPMHGAEKAFRLCERWAGVFTRPEHRAQLLSFMAEYALRGRHHEAALSLVDQADSLMERQDGAAGDDCEKAERSCRLQRSRIYTRVGRTEEALPRLPSVAKGGVAQKAYAMYLWADTLLAAGEKNEAMVYLQQLHDTVATHRLHLMQSRLDALARRL